MEQVATTSSRTGTFHSLRLSRNQLISVFWLVLPWLTLTAIITSILTDFASWLIQILPFGIGRLAIQNAGWGMLILTFASSARWAYLRLRDEGRVISSMVMEVIGAAIFLTIAHGFLALSVLYIGLLVWRSF